MKPSATYSPEDNKLRLYPVSRLDKETYARVKAAGFKWAPKQELFVAPAWSPEREDLLLELCGEIEDEDKSLVERAEERAERFEDYSDKRNADAERAHAAVAAIADNIPLGQPILVGHHSEKHARKDKERIENGMRRAVKAWETANYWADRAKGALAAAKYKELPTVRYRRIKTLESALRKHKKQLDEHETKLKLWDNNGQPLDLKKALLIANYADYGIVLPNGKSDWSAWGALERGDVTPEYVQDRRRAGLPKTIAWEKRWIAHLENRLAYEKAMLGESGGLAVDKFDLKPGGQVLTHGLWLTIVRVNKKDGAATSVSTNNRSYPRVVSVEKIKDYRPPTEENAAKVASWKKLPPLCNYPGDGFLPMTEAEWKRIHGDYKTSKIVESEAAGRHRVRWAWWGGKRGFVFLTDAKRKDAPAKELAPPAPALPPVENDMATLEREAARRKELREKAAKDTNPAAALKETLKAGVQVVTAPQLFPTPPELARQVVDLADVRPGQRILEPSAGTGNLVKAAHDRVTGADCVQVVAVEFNQAVASQLEARRNLTLYATDENYRVVAKDFLECNGDLGTFDRIVMNPPFANAADIRHVEHARKFLKPGGRLVAIVANGPRQREKLMPEADQWIDLPAGSFKEAGTNVNAAIAVFDAPEVRPPQTSLF